MPIRIAFVDRDGTINVERNHLHRREDFEYLPRAVEGLRVFGRNGAKIIIVTNQAGIAKGLYGEAEFNALTDWMLADLAARGVVIDQVVYCPHHPQGVVAEYRRECDCRKPGTALLSRALEQHGVDARDAVLVGDKNTDIEAGRRLGLTTCLVETGYGAAEKAHTGADFIAIDLEQAALQLIAAKFHA